MRNPAFSIRAVSPAILLGALALAICPAAARPASPPSQEVSVITPPGGGLGEISQYAADGKLLFRWTGFSDIASIEGSRPESLMVFERGRNRFVEFDRSGVVRRTVAFQPMNVLSGAVLPDGHLLLAAGREGAVELDRSGGLVWRAPPVNPAAEIAGAVRLADGTTLWTARFAPAPLYQIPAGSTRSIPVALPGVGPFEDRWQRPGLRVLDAASQQVALWYGPWRSWYQFQWKEGALEGWSAFPAKGDVSAVASGRSHSAWAAEAQFEVVRLSSSGEEIGSFAVADAIRDLTDDETGGVLVAVERTQNAERPAWRPPSPGHTPFSWVRLGLWMLGSLLLIGVLQMIVWRSAISEGEPTWIPAKSSSDSFPQEVHSHFRAWITCVLAVATGLGMASIGCHRLQEQHVFQAIPFYVPGALLIAIAGQWWRRVICGESDHWWVEVRAARVPRGLFVPTCWVVAILLTGGLLLWRWRSRGIHENASISLWASLQILCFGLAMLSPMRPRPHQRRIPWQTLLHVAILLLLTSIALTIDLAGVPQNVHHDVGLNVDHALRLLEGRVDNFFSGAYGEVPYPSYLPTSLSLLLTGKTVAGSRLGECLMGLVAVLGTYALGREYKSPRLGLFAGILLVASIPFLHFSRVPNVGEVAAYSVWLLYSLLYAVRTAHPGAWLVCGLMGGWGLFFLYASRVALVGVVVAGILLSLRSLRVTLHRWYGPLLFILAFAVTVVPMVPYWLSHPAALFHRMDTSFSLYDSQTGFHPEVLSRAFGKPFVKTLGMFFTEGDVSGNQPMLSPAAMPIEATLLLIGLAAVLTDGWGSNVACLGWFAVMLLGCGALTTATPGYHRLVAITPVASLFMARGIDVQLDLIPLKRPLWRWAVTAVVTAALIGGVVVKRLEIYLSFEHSIPTTDFTAFGRAALALGPRYQFYCVTFQRPDFSCQHGSFVPFLATLDVADLRDPVRAMPFPAGRPVAIMIPFNRFVPRALDPEALVKEIALRYPGAELRFVHRTPKGLDPPNGVIVVVSPGLH